MRYDDPELLAAFLEETLGYVPAITASLEAFARTSEVAHLDDAHRLLHTIKGAAAMLGFNEISAAASRIEDLTERLMTRQVAVDDQIKTALFDGFETVNAHLLRLAAHNPCTASIIDEPTEAIFNQASSATSQSESFSEPTVKLPAMFEHQVDDFSTLPTAFEATALTGSLVTDGKFDLAAIEAAVLESLLNDASLETSLSETMPECEDKTLPEARHDSLTGVSIYPTVFEPPAAYIQHPERLPEASEVFANDTRHDGLITQPPSVTTVGETETVDDEMLEVFREEADEHLRVMGASLATLEHDANDVNSLLELCRSTHTLKGAAGVVGLRTVSALAHRMEDLLDRVCDTRQRLSDTSVSAMVRAVDVIEHLTRGASPLTHQPAVAELSEIFARELACLAMPNIAANEMVVRHERDEARSKAEVDTPLSETVKPPIVSNGALREDAQPEVRDVHSDAQSVRRVVRVPLERLDAIVKLVGELVISRTTFEGRLTALQHEVAELERSTERLKRVAHKLETEYETASLRSGAERFAANGKRATHGTDFFVPSALTHELLSEAAIEKSFAANDSTPHDASRQPPADHEVFEHQPRSNQPLENQESANMTSSFASDFDELEFDRYTEFHRLSREIGETTSDTGAVKNEIANLASDFEALLTRQRRLTNEVHERLMRVRMVDIGTLASRLQRTVRVAADAEYKAVDFTLEGTHVELDTTVIDRMADPLLHILRNAVSHGIERADIRRAIGKPERGHIHLRAGYEGAQVVLEITDDGNGIDAAAVCAKAVENNFISFEAAQALTDKQALTFIFKPGLSTAKQVSEISGRGIGMDVVKDRVESLQGTIDLESTPGKGTRLTIRLPLTLIATRALMVRAANETYAVPSTAVQQITRATKRELQTMRETSSFAYDHETHTAIYLSQWLQLTEDFTLEVERAPVLILNTAGRTAALVVDEIIEGRDIVIKSLGAHLHGVRGLMGATVMGDGRVVPILNADDIVRGEQLIAVETHAEQVALRVRRAAHVERTARELRVMIVDDSPSVRRVMANTLRHAEMHTLAAKDGLEALELLHASANTELPDIILLDVEMPRMDGYELLATLRQQTLTRTIPVVMITSRTGDKHRRKALTLGASEYLTKPYLEEDLLAHIARLTTLKTER